jgi:hypothetical protein
METSMKSLLVGAAMLAIVAPPAFAQSQSPSQNQTSAKATVNQGQNLAAAQKIKICRALDLKTSKWWLSHSWFKLNRETATPC